MAQFRYLLFLTARRCPVVFVLWVKPADPPFRAQGATGNPVNAQPVVSAESAVHPQNTQY